MKLAFRNKAVAGITYFSGLLAAIGLFNMVEHIGRNNQAAFSSFMFSFVFACVIAYLAMTGGITKK